MENTNEKRLHQVAEIQLTYKSNASGFEGSLVGISFFSFDNQARARRRSVI